MKIINMQIHTDKQSVRLAVGQKSGLQVPRVGTGGPRWSPIENLRQKSKDLMTWINTHNVVKENVNISVSSVCNPVLRLFRSLTQSILDLSIFKEKQVIFS